MTPTALVADLARRDIALTADGDNLAFDAPSGELTPEDLEVIRANKADLLVYLAARVAGSPEPGPSAPHWRPIAESWPSRVRDEWQERASIMHIDGGLPLHLAEHRAFLEITGSPVGLALTRAGDDPAAIEAALDRHGYVGEPVSIEVPKPPSAIEEIPAPAVAEPDDDPDADFLALIEAAGFTPINPASPSASAWVRDETASVSMKSVHDSITLDADLASANV
jgi:hypothetical protein